MTVQLAPEIEALIQRHLASGRYDSETDVLLNAFEALDERQRERFVQLQQKVREGFEDPVRISVTPELIEEIEREVEARYSRGEQPSPDVAG